MDEKILDYRKGRNNVMERFRSKQFNIMKWFLVGSIRRFVSFYLGQELMELFTRCITQENDFIIDKLIIQEKIIINMCYYNLLFDIC